MHVALQDLTRLGEESTMKQLLVVDTNVLLKQMDLLERDCPALTCIVILQTVAEEVTG
jgi:hypothetical protein